MSWDGLSFLSFSKGVMVISLGVMVPETLVLTLLPYSAASLPSSVRVTLMVRLPAL